MAYFKTYNEFVNEIWNPAPTVAAFLAANQAMRNRNKGNDDKGDNKPAKDCKYKDIGIGTHIEFTFKGKYYKLEYKSSDFNKLLDDPEYLCKYIDKNKNKWEINND